MDDAGPSTRRVAASSALSEAVVPCRAFLTRLALVAARRFAAR
ncbi:hypothetical protein HNR21_000232 [Actinomadura cellulosilytica]|uniref:Uncharacterized protein n=1 Tax=Thermomonospora cellulosilytica TaxID=1411118 RepID=A0A7W3R6H1_9ACTN|nr:hypothetical protein [Thermomonospora cellulosilytica]